MLNFLKSWATEIVAALALIQPWVLALWRYLRKGTVDIYETGFIEVGYSTFGATVGMQGTLRAVSRDQFIRSIELTVTKLKDSSRHIFEWGVFRSEKVLIGRPEQMSLELPSGFMLTTAQPRRYNIQFFDRAIQSEMQPHIIKVSQEWTKEFTAKGGGTIAQTADQPSVRDAVERAFNQVYQEFSRGSLSVSTYTALDRLYYWEPGQYLLLMRVNTARPDRSFERSWAFGLSEQESNNLRLNTVRIIDDACGRQSYGQYYFVYVKYQTPP